MGPRQEFKYRTCILIGKCYKIKKLKNMSHFLIYINIPHDDLEDHIFKFRMLKLLLSFALKHGSMERGSCCLVDHGSSPFLLIPACVLNCKVSLVHIHRSPDLSCPSCACISFTPGGSLLIVQKDLRRPPKQE